MHGAYLGPIPFSGHRANLISPKGHLLAHFGVPSVTDNAGSRFPPRKVCCFVWISVSPPPIIPFLPIPYSPWFQPPSTRPTFFPCHLSDYVSLRVGTVAYRLEATHDLS